MPIGSAIFIQALAELWGETPLPALPSRCTVRFTFAVSAAQTVGAGIRVTDGTNLWAVTATTSAIGFFVDALVACTVPGSQTNHVAPGQIAELVDVSALPGCSGVSNTTETISGRDLESTEDFRTRLRSVPESKSTCGPRGAYEALALAASASVADVVALGADDASEMVGVAPAPGEVHLIVIEGTRDANGVLTGVVPDPSGGLLTAVSTACSAEDVRPLTDHVLVKAPQWVDFDLYCTYYIARSRSASALDIQAAVEAAFAAYELWQQSSIGRDINPSELTTMIVNAGAKRVQFSAGHPLTFTVLARDQAARLGYPSLTYGGVEDD